MKQILVPTLVRVECSQTGPLQSIGRAMLRFPNIKTLDVVVGQGAAVARLGMFLGAGHDHFVVLYHDGTFLKYFLAAFQPATNLDQSISTDMFL